MQASIGHQGKGHTCDIPAEPSTQLPGISTASPFPRSTSTRRCIHIDRHEGPHLDGLPSILPSAHRCTSSPLPTVMGGAAPTPLPMMPGTVGIAAALKQKRRRIRLPHHTSKTPQHHNHRARDGSRETAHPRQVERDEIEAIGERLMMRPLTARTSMEFTRLTRQKTRRWWDRRTHA
jgi:hypothetical protein